MSQGRSLLEAQQASGLNAEMLRALLDRFRKEGVKGALFGLHRAPSACRYDQDAIVEALKILVVSRPVSGLYWTLRSLADEIGKMVPGGGDISHEHLRQIMLKRLGIRSIRHIEPYWKQQLARKVASVA
ncbi:MAG: helix-turn-helix domain-containing protein [Verrucomicrobiaceae bacterium]|nr:helix-turn-helix domain-containing protein [Verrucomicrobiaceae bacterium]